MVGGFHSYGVAFALLGCVAACGKPSAREEALDAGMKPVVGEARFGSQCPYGFYSEPRVAEIGLWDCKIPLDSVELAEPMSPLLLSADCKKKILTIRTADRRVDTSWEVMPDGTFNITLDGLSARLRRDGPTGSQCVSYLTTEVFGRVDCKDRDKAAIQFDTMWWLNKGARPAAAVPGAANERACSFPSSCYLHSSGTIRQCE
jgi:hypothetical protein